MMPRRAWWFRADSADRIAIDHTYDNNGYHMPDDMTGQRVLDIGAHIGSFTALCAERGAVVTACEPYRPNFELLTQNCWAEAAVFHVGLGATTGLDYLSVHPNNTGGHSTVLESVRNIASDSFAVPVTTLDLLMARCDIWDVVKLDCEGAEVYAIPALAAGLHERAKVIVMEFHQEDPIEQEALRSQLYHYYEAENLFQAEWRFTHK